jgi:hypothetical protein
MFSPVMQPAAYSSPRKVWRATPPPFPILTLDERKLTPALGYLFSAKWIDPCESLVTILWKFEKANALPGHVAALLMGADIDPYEGVAPQAGVIDIRRLRDTLNVPLKILHGSLLVPSQRRRYSKLFRYCRCCLARGYHSVLHQIDGVDVCPAHRRPLETACRRCGYEAPYVLSVRFLDAPYRCAYCRAGYSHKVFSVLSSQRMKKDERIAMNRFYFQRYFG